MASRGLAKFLNAWGVLLVCAVTLVADAGRAAAQSATIRASAQIVRPLVPAAALDSAVTRVARDADRSGAGGPTTSLPAGVQVRAIARVRETDAREVRVEFIAN